MKVSKNFLTTLTLLLVAAIAVLNVAPTSAVTYTDHQNAYGTVVLNIDDHPQILIDSYHIDYSTTFGTGDVIRIWYNTTQGYLPVAVITDIPERVSFFEELYGILPTSIQLVDTSAITLLREVHSKTLLAVWATTLQVPEEHWGPTGALVTPALTIPPGLLIFKGYGGVITGSSTTIANPLLGQTWNQTITWTGYYAHATLFCPAWHFFGRVGENEMQNRTAVRFDATVVSTG